MGDTEQNEQEITGLINPFVDQAGGLLPALHALQENYGYIDGAAIPILADHFNQTRADVHGVISFYHDFRSEKPARHIVKICQAEACQAMGSRALVDHVNAHIAGDITIEKVYCLGNCACGPAVMVDGRTYGRVDAARLNAIVASHRSDAKS
jgi:formate dehydrogenase subunit gamma